MEGRSTSYQSAVRTCRVLACFMEGRTTSYQSAVRTHRVLACFVEGRTSYQSAGRYFVEGCLNTQSTSTSMLCGGQNNKLSVCCQNTQSTSMLRGGQNSKLSVSLYQSAVRTETNPFTTALCCPQMFFGMAVGFAIMRRPTPLTNSVSISF